MTLEWLKSWVRGWFASLFFAELAADEQARQVAALAARKAELLRLAAKYREEGFPDLADDLIRQAQELSLSNPVGACQPVFSPAPLGPATPPPALPAPPAPAPKPQLAHAPMQPPKRRGRPPKALQNSPGSNHQPTTDPNRTH
jgi:hypothetical protein